MRIKATTVTVTAAVFLGAMLATPAALAHEETSDDGSATTATDAPSKRWYGWQTLAADGVADALLVTGLVTDEQGFATAWMVSFPLATPTLHAFHRNPLETGVSFGLRLALPILGGLFSGWAQPENYECSEVEPALPGGPEPEDSLCPPPRFLVGAAIGGLVASAFDAGYLAFEDAPQVRRSLGNARRREAAFVAPRLAIHRDALSLGLVGGF